MDLTGDYKLKIVLEREVGQEELVRVMKGLLTEEQLEVLGMGEGEGGSNTTDRGDVSVKLHWEKLGKDLGEVGKGKSVNTERQSGMEGKDTNSNDDKTKKRIFAKGKGVVANKNKGISANDGLTLTGGNKNVKGNGMGMESIPTILEEINSHKNKSVRNVEKEEKREDGSNEVLPVAEIVGYLNHMTGESYQVMSRETRKLIEGWIKKGYTVKDFMKVIDKKCSDWIYDRKMKRYLRPKTLFGPRFEAYLNEGGSGRVVD